MSITRLVALGSVALIAALAVVGAAGADTYDSQGLEAFDLGSVDGQDGWHSKPVPPAIPQGYDQEVVDPSLYGGPAEFGTRALRLSNLYSHPTDEFENQTYSKSTDDDAGEQLTNKVFVGSYQFFGASYQPNRMISVSPDDGHGGRMSYLGLTDTPGGIQATFFQVKADGSFEGFDAGLYDYGEAHTVEFQIEFVPGEANDVLRLIIDGTDIGDELGVCFTTWESFYRAVNQAVPVTNSLEFRADNTGTYGTCDRNNAQLNADGACEVSSLLPENGLGKGYLFDNVVTTTAESGGPAGGCGGPTTADLTVKKFYDANADGDQDAGESDITGWKVEVSNGVDPDQIGTTEFAATGLTPGDYTASEFSPIQSNWHPTTPTSVNVPLAAGDDTTVSFGNVCTGDGGGLTIGFWTNKNGQALITNAQVAALSGLNLRNANGSNFDPANKQALKTWLSNATATNMAYMLSAQLAAMKLNVDNNKVSGSDLVYAPGVIQGDDFITITQLMDEANTALGADGITPSGDPNRSYQETLKNALDKANQDNSTVFVQSTPCAFSFAS